jgi:cobalamin biosynthesis protein CobD/CbiB
MQKATKAALLSALVFPGCGHLFLKHYLPGALLASISLGALYVLFSRAMEQATQIAAQLQAGELPMDSAAIADMVMRQVSTADTQMLNIASTTLLICWLVGIVDAWRLGRKQDGQTMPPVGL